MKREFKTIIRDDFACLPDSMAGEKSHQSEDLALAYAMKAMRRISCTCQTLIAHYPEQMETHIIVDEMFAVKVFPTYPELLPCIQGK